MQEVIKIILGLLSLVLAVFIGNILAKHTKEELKDGKKWFKAILWISFVLALIGIFFMVWSVVFTFLFIFIITMRSIRKH